MNNNSLATLPSTSFVHRELQQVRFNRSLFLYWISSVRLT